MLYCFITNNLSSLEKNQRMVTGRVVMDGGPAHLTSRCSFLLPCSNEEGAQSWNSKWVEGRAASFTPSCNRMSPLLLPPLPGCHTWFPSIQGCDYQEKWWKVPHRLLQKVTQCLRPWTRCPASFHSLIFFSSISL